MPDDSQSVADPDITIFEHTREAWLNRLVEIFRPYFARLKYPLPEKIYISVGKPDRGATTSGICYPAYLSDDGGTHIFVHPVISNPVRVAGLVAHELCHAALDCEGGHGREFKKLATAMGLTGKMTKTVEGPAFLMLMDGVPDRIGPYPHAALRSNSRKKTRDQRLIKVFCPLCRFCFWASAKWLKQITHPGCLNPTCDGYGDAMEILWPERQTGKPIFERPDFET